MKTKLNKIISLVLALIMVMGMIPITTMTSFAATEVPNMTDRQAITYSDGVSQYVKHNNFLYKVTFTNLNPSYFKTVAVSVNSWNEVRLFYSYSNHVIVKDAEASYLPTTQGGSHSFYLYPKDTRAIDYNKPVVTFTCVKLSEPTWNWSEDSAKAVFTVSEADVCVTVDARVSSETLSKAENCVAKDQIKYTAAATLSGKEYTTTKIADGAAGPHTLTYSSDGYTITEKCRNCTHNATATLALDPNVSLIYTGSAIKPLKVIYSDGWQGGTMDISYENNVNAGKANGSISAAHDYGITFANQGFTIQPRTIEGVTANGYSGNYDGAAHGISVNGAPNNAVIMYRQNENEEYSFTNPMFTDCGSYTVYYKVAVISGFTIAYENEVAYGSATVEITPADISAANIIVNPESEIYTGSAYTPSVAVTFNGTPLIEDTHYTVSWDKTGFTDPGTYTVTVKGTGNFVGIKTLTFEIKKGFYSFEAPSANNLIYNAEEQALVIAGTTNIGEMEYSLNGVEWATDVPVAKDVGEYNVYYRIIGNDNYNDVEDIVTVTIAECPHESYTDGICNNCKYSCPHNYDYTKSEDNLTRPTESTKGYYTYICKNGCDKTVTEEVECADYTAYDEATAKVAEYLVDETITDEAKAYIVSAIKDTASEYTDENGYLKRDLIETEQDIVNYGTSEVNRIVADIEEKIASGEYVKADYTAIDEAIKAIDEALETATINNEMNAELEDIKADLAALKADVNTSKLELENSGLIERAAAIAEIMNACANGNHSFTVYTESKAAECEANAEETAACDNGCGATDTREVENTALGHADEDGDTYCDNGGEQLICPDCGRPVHAYEGIPQFICFIIMFINLVKSMFA